MKKILFVLLMFGLIGFCDASSINIENSFSEEYNLEDKLILNFSIFEKSDSSGFIEVILNCGGENISVYKAFHEINHNTKKYYLLGVPLLMEGICNISILYNNQKYFSDKFFYVTKDIDITLEFGDVTINPLEKIIINGSVNKKTGDIFSGEIKVYSEFFNRSFFINKGDGKFYFEEIIEIDSKPGNYSLVVEGILKNIKGEIINYGRVEKEFRILSKVSNIIILSNESIKPPVHNNFKVILTDQSENVIYNKSVLVKIFDSERKIVYEENINSGNYSNYYFKSDSIKGGWEINAYYGKIFARKPLYILKNENVRVDVVDCGIKKCFEIKNIGNVFYQGPVEIIIRNNDQYEKLFYNVEINVGREKLIEINNEGIYEVYYDGNLLEIVSPMEVVEPKNSFLNPTGLWLLPKVKINVYSYLASIMFIIFLILFYIAIIKNRILKKTSIRHAIHFSRALEK
ncbi:hypothetical protein GOV12_06565 [Candidatus Pacearchaeota archaeon]|nr:hypothetical protein [Candidatus Pacearchaeota archaeon]